MASKALLLEQYIHRNFVGATRFSVEVCEEVAPAIVYLLQQGSEMGVRQYERVMGESGG